MKPSRVLSKRIGAFVFVLCAVIAACKKDPPPTPTPDPNGSSTTNNTVTPPTPAGDATHGKELVLKYQCNRCHDGTGHPAAEQGKHCVHCHEDIVEGKFKAPPATVARWIPRVKDLQFAPSLEATNKRLTRTFIESYIQEPLQHFRPGLIQSMPRLSMNADDARDIATYLHPDADVPSQAPKGADMDLGRRVLDSKGCGSCHTISGASPLVVSPIPVPIDQAVFAKAKLIAPDFRYTRDRYTYDNVVRWITNPHDVKSDTPMPTLPLSKEEIVAAASYIMTAQLDAPRVKPVPERLPVLTRKVTYDEVDKKVFHRTCWHCHSEPDFAIGDGGPGNSGGFGFKPRLLNLVSYEGMTAGMVDDKGERISAFAKTDDGTSIMVKSLINRYAEEAGAPTAHERGMPLGYPSISLEDIQLVESWIVQGRPRG